MRVLFYAGLVAGAVAFLLSACAEERPPEPTPSPQDGRPLDVETVDMGQMSGAAGQRPQVLKIDTAVDWQEFWTRHTAGAIPVTDLPPVDFSREMVIVAVDEVEPTGGYRFQITDVLTSGDTLTVLVNKAVPGSACLVSEALTQPYHIVRTAKSSLTLEPVIKEETYGCD